MPTIPSEMLDRFCDFTEENHLFSENEPILCALSGGADSVVLLHLLLAAKEPLSLGEIAVLHVNHGLRGDAADRDEAFCQSLCARWNVPFTAVKADVPAAVAETGESVEQAARRLRYEALFSEASGAVVTAHTASDNAETVLLHLTRGSGLHGLCGILPKRDNLVRPLLFATRTDVEAYAAENGLEYVTDETNDDTAYSRNRIRAAVMPELKEINPQVETALWRLCETLREDEECLHDQGQLLLECAEFEEQPGVYDREVLKAAPPAILRRAVLQMLPTTINVEKQHIDGLCRLTTDDGALTLPGDIVVVAKNNEMYLAESEEDIPPFRFPVSADEYVMVAGEPYELRLFSAEEFEKCRNVHSLLFNSCCDYATIKGDLFVRNRLPGDAYRPVGRDTKTLKKLWNEAGLSANERAKMPLLCDENGILLVPGFGCDERAKLTPQTEQVLVFAKTEAF